MDETEARIWSTLTTGIYILTTRADGRGHGMSASWVTQVAAEPPLLAAAVGRQSYTHQWIVAQRMFGLNVVGRGSKKLQDYFHSAAARRPGNLDGVEWFWSPRGVPWLPLALVSLECHVVQEMLVGERTLFVATVTSYRWGLDDKPLSSHDLPYVFVGEVRSFARRRRRLPGGQGQ